MFKKFRITALAYVLFLVAGGAWLTMARTTDWDDPLWVLVYPINADDSAAVGDYISGLERDHVLPIEHFFRDQGRRYGLTIERPFAINLAAPVDGLPPAPPSADRDTNDAPNPLAVMWWSLKLRYWALQVQRQQSEPEAHIQIFVLYHDPAEGKVLPHSLGLQKGLIGVVHAFASPVMAGSNNVVIAHELLHTVGAVDKYDPHTSVPRYPDGFAEPRRKPLYPQRHAELMGGRVPLAADKAEVPSSLAKVVIGPRTATEIGWVADD